MTTFMILFSDVWIIGGGGGGWGSHSHYFFYIKLFAGWNRTSVCKIIFPVVYSCEMLPVKQCIASIYCQ